MRKILFVFSVFLVMFVLAAGCTNKNKEAAERIDTIQDKVADLYNEAGSDVTDFSDEDTKKIESLIDQEEEEKADLNEENTDYLEGVQGEFNQAKDLHTLENQIDDVFDEDTVKEEYTKDDITALKSNLKKYKKTQTVFYEEQKSELKDAEEQVKERDEASAAVDDLFTDNEVKEDVSREDEDEADELADKVKNKGVKDSLEDSLAEVDDYLTAKEEEEEEEKRKESEQKQQQAKDKKYIALTFDDGPEEGSTEQILDTLQQYEADATFFMLGEKAQENPGLAKRVADEGHEVANHSITHPDLANLDQNQVRDEMQDSQNQIEEATGTKPNLFRPPYGSRSDSVDTVANETDQQLVFWDIDTMDWKNQDPQEMGKIIEEQVHPGSVILMHDIHQTSADAVPEILATLKSQGYEFVKVSDVI